VSRVINNEKYVSEDMREHVLKVISEMNYQPDAVARGLRTKSTHIISLVIPDICNPYFPEVSRGVQSVADLHEYIMKKAGSAKKNMRNSVRLSSSAIVF